MASLNCNVNHFESTLNIWKFFQDLGPTLVSIIAILTTLCITNRTLKAQASQNLKTLNAQKDIETRKSIQKKINEFYGPLIQQRIKSSKLYDKFSAKHRAKDKSFSTLTYLLNNNQFDVNDKILLAQIIKLGKDSERLIQEKSGLIDDYQLRTDILPRATTHFLVVELAYECGLKGNSDEFKDLTYPKELLSKLEERKAQLEVDLENLNKRES